LKVEQSAEDDRTLQAEDAVTGLVPVEVFNMERFLRG
jgi:hypothetical protein